MSKISPESWRALSPYLDRALTMEDGERTAWLASIRERHPELAGDLLSLLDEHRMVAEERFLEERPNLLPVPPAVAGQTLDAYTLIRPIGQGGMASVWLAERSDGRFEREAAVKFLHIALAGPGGSERFKREGAILGQLEHPHIAQLLDAGVSPAGQPYLILEHVSGEPIDRYCDERTLDIDSRIRLFLDVLAAVAHAHANLIVHRDLKPSNVLVSAEGSVKLLDFGIAKLVGAEGQSGAATALTREAGSAMTLLYAAPEQVKDEIVTTAIDVYALGVLLFLLLTGQHPAGPGPYSAAGLIKNIADAEAPRPSDVADSDKSRRLLRGDLDTIISKALKKNPKERYASVTAFADDLRRHLKHEPVAARPDTLAYRAAKFIRRNRTAVALAALAFVASIIAVVGTTIQARTANRERIIAQRRFNEVRQLSNKLFDIEKQVLEIPGAVKARQLIVDTSLDYLGRLAKDARTDPDLALDLGFAYLRVARIQGVPVTHTMGQSEKAEESLQKAESLIASVLAAQPSNRTAFLRAAQIAHDRMVLAEYRVPDDGALPLARQSRAWLEKYLNTGKVEEGEHDQVALAGTNVANWYIRKDLVGEGLQLLQRMIAVAKEANLNRRVGAAQIIAARALRSIGDLDAALAASREAVSLTQPPPGAKLGPTSGLALLTQGEVLGEDDAVSLGRPREALEYFERSFGQALDFVRRDSNDAVSKLSLANRGGKLAGVVGHWDPKRAIEIYDEVLLRLAEIKNNPKARRDEVRALAGSTFPLCRMGRSAEARQRLDLAFSKLRDLKLYPEVKIEPCSEPVTALRAFAEFEAGTGKVQRGIEIYQELVTKLRASAPQPEANLEAATELSNIYRSMAQLHRRTGQLDLASAVESRRAEIWRHWEHKLPNNRFVLSQIATVVGK